MNCYYICCPDHNLRAIERERERERNINWRSILNSSWKTQTSYHATAIFYDDGGCGTISDPRRNQYHSADVVNMHVSLGFPHNLYEIMIEPLNIV